MSRARSASTTDDSSESSESSLSSSQGGQQFKVVVGADSFKDKPVAKWSIKEVCGWLNANGFEEYAQFFVDEMVDGESLITLSTGDLNNLGIKKLGQRNKLFNKIEKLKETGLAVGRSDASSSLASGSEDGGEPVTIKALFKQKTATLKVSSTITLDSLLNKLAEAFGGIRVKIRIVDDDEEQIAIGNDIELANVLAGEDQVEFQCSKDLKATAAGVSSKSSKSPSASSSSSSGVAPAAPAAASRSINVNFDLFETLLDGYCAIDEDGLVLYVNAALERMFGYSRRKVIGHNVKMLMPDSYAKKHDMYLARYMTTGVKHVVDKARVVMAKAANGAMFPITLSVTEKKSSDGLTYFIGAMKLATEAGEDAAGAAAGAGAAAAVVDEFAGVRKTLDALQEAAVVIDETGRIVVFNGAAEKLFGHKASAIIDQPVETLMPSPFKENHAFYLSRYVATGKKTVMGSSRDVQALRADGTVIVVNLALSEEKSKSGDPLFIGLLTPAVKRATAPSASASAASGAASTSAASGGAGAGAGGESLLQQLRKTVNGMSMAGFIVNDHGVLHAFNAAATKLLGHELIDIVGRSVTLLLDAKEAADGDKAVALLRSYIGKETTVTVRHKTGAPIEARISVTESAEAGAAGKKFLVCFLHMTSAALEEKKTKRKKKRSSTSSHGDGSTSSEQKK